jgi:hypothetical protein
MERLWKSGAKSTNISWAVTWHGTPMSSSKCLQRRIRRIVVSRWVRVQTNRANANDEATPAFDLHFRTSASCACFPAGVLNRRDEQQCRRRACILLPSRYSLFTRVFSIVPNNILSPAISHVISKPTTSTCGHTRPRVRRTSPRYLQIPFAMPPVKEN